jgi:hypothetical protein
VKKKLCHFNALHKFGIIIFRTVALKEQYIFTDESTRPNYELQIKIKNKSIETNLRMAKYENVIYLQSPKYSE